MKIDVFAHVLPARYLEERNRRAGAAFSSQYRKYSSAVPALHDLDVRFRVMDQFDDVVQLLTIAGPNIESITNPADTVELARIANDEMADLVAKYPDRFVGAVQVDVGGGAGGVEGGGAEGVGGGGGRLAELAQEILGGALGALLVAELLAELTQDLVAGAAIVGGERRRGVGHDL